MTIVSNNQRKRERAARTKMLLRKYPEVFELRRVIAIAGSSSAILHLTAGEVEDDGAMLVHVLGKNYRVVLEHIVPKLVVFYGSGEYRKEFLDLESALDFCKAWGTCEPVTRIEGVLTEAEQRAVAAAGFSSSQPAAAGERER